MQTTTLEFTTTQGLAWDDGKNTEGSVGWGRCPLDLAPGVVVRTGGGTAGPVTVLEVEAESGLEMDAAGVETLPGALTESEQAWLCEVRGGNEDAARLLVERLHPLILRVVRSHLPRRTQEEDLVQAVYAKIFKSLGQFSGRVPLEHWVSRIAVNTCFNQLKHESIRPELRMGDLTEEEEVVIQHLASTEEDIPESQRAAASDLLAKLMSHLRPDERTVITLLHLEERTVDEVRALTGWSASLVKVKAFRARNRMRTLCRELGLSAEW